MTMFEPVAVVTIALKTSLLFFGVGLIILLMPKKSAAWQHLFWTAALALSLLMPFAVAYLPSYVTLPLPWEAAEPWVRDEPDLVAAGARHVGTEPDTPDARQERRSTSEYQTGAAWPTALIVWLIGALGVCLRNALAHVGLIRWVRKARSDLSPAWATTLRELTGEAKARGSLRVLESDRTASPCTWGFMRPVILLPAAGADWSEPQRRLALLHELAHVRRFDYLTTQMANLACAVHWFNAFVWFAAARARALQERACDDVVLNAGGMPSDYARFLVNVADSSRRLSWAAPTAVGMVQRSQLHGRVTAILDASELRLPLPGLALFAVLIPLACLMLFLATLSAAAAPVATRPGVPLAASFNAVELRHGGTATVVHGEPQRVTVLKGEPGQSEITVRDNGWLVIEGSHGLEVEVVTPALMAIAVAEGGRIHIRGDFPDQREIAVKVRQGGAIDIRSLPVANVTASVYSGGRIFTRPGTALSADVEQGGNITYWGDAIVESSVRYGGVVVKGAAADADRLLAELTGPSFVEPPAPIPPVPPVPAIPPIGH
jgi:beta-lactamase regulating signal transducer with metallopeptidase domain